MLSLSQLIETLGSNIYSELQKQCYAVKLNVASPIGTAFPIRFNNSSVRIAYVAILPWLIDGTAKTRNDALFWTSVLERMYSGNKIAETLKKLAIEHILTPLAQFADHSNTWADKEISGESLSHDRWRISDTHSLLVQIMDPALFVSTATEYMANVFSYEHFGEKLQTFDNTMYIMNAFMPGDTAMTPGAFVMPFYAHGKAQITDISVPFPNVPMQYLTMLRDAVLAINPDSKRRMVFDAKEARTLRENAGIPLIENSDELFYYSVKSGTPGRVFQFILPRSFIKNNDVCMLSTVSSSSEVTKLEEELSKEKNKHKQESDALLEKLDKQEKELGERKLEISEIRENLSKTEKELSELKREHAGLLEEQTKLVELFKSQNPNITSRATRSAATGANTRGGVCVISAGALLEELQKKEAHDLHAILGEDSDLGKLGNFLVTYMPSAFDAVSSTAIQEQPTDTPTPEISLCRIVTDLQEVYETIEKSIPARMQQEIPVANIKDCIGSALRGVHGNSMARFKPRREVVKQIRFEQMARKLLRNLLARGNDARSFAHTKEIARVLSVADTHASPEDIAMLKIFL